MGGCIGSARDGSLPNGDSSDGTGAVSIGRNQPLKPDRPKWKSDVPLSEIQLRGKREEFWDTAPAFEGRKEIWDALKAAVYAMEMGDNVMAQAIVDGANISLPHGTLLDSYDELGNRYQLPIYVMSPPTNLISEPAEASSGNGSEEAPPKSPGVEMQVKFRLSTGKDIRLPVRSTDTVLAVKKQIQAEEGVEFSRQKWCFQGKILSDKMRIEDAKIPKGYVVQVIVSQAQTPVAT